jgi:anion-transporting  ArsA/GET3 family ATPase
MKTFRQIVRWNWIGALSCLVLGGIASGQTSSAPTSTTTTTPATSTLLATQQAYQQEQNVLFQQQQALIAQGATPAQIEAWQQQNATQFAAQQQLALQMAAEVPTRPMTLITSIEVPEGATPAMADFLTTRADLYNRYAQIYNAQLQPGPLTLALQTQIETTFEDQNQAEQATEIQQAQTIAAESASQPVPVPPPLVIPANATREIAAFLTTRDHLIRSQIQVQNQYLSATPAQQQAAMDQWQEQNASLLQQYQQEAQTLATPSSTTTTISTISN